MHWTKNEKPIFPISEKAVKRQLEKYTSYRRSVLRRKSQPTPEKLAQKLKRAKLRKERKDKGIKKLFIIKNGKRVPVNSPKKNKDLSQAEAKEDDGSISHNEDSEDSETGSHSDGKGKGSSDVASHGLIRAEDNSSDENHSDLNQNLIDMDSQKDIFETEMWEQEQNKLRNKRQRKNSQDELSSSDDDLKENKKTKNRPLIDDSDETDFEGN